MSLTDLRESGVPTIVGSLSVLIGWECLVRERDARSSRAPLRLIPPLLVNSRTPRSRSRLLAYLLAALELELGERAATSRAAGPITSRTPNSHAGVMRVRSGLDAR